VEDRDEAGPPARVRARRQGEFIGLPGNPVSSFVTFLIFVRPFLLRPKGSPTCSLHAIPVRADFDWPEPDLRREFLRVKWNARAGSTSIPPGLAVLTSTRGLTPGRQSGRAPHPRRDMVKFMPYSELYR